MKTILQLRQIEKSYGTEHAKTEVLKGINFEAVQGEAIAVMGPSGAGKTTLLDILGGLETPDSGEIFFRGNVVNYRNKTVLAGYRKENIAFVFQQYELIKEFTVQENIELPLRIRGVSRRKRHELSLDVSEKMHIEALLDQRPENLSGGEQQRVAIARAIVADTPIILADEPTGALDSENGKTVMEILMNLKESGRTIIYVTHDKTIAAYADRQIYLLDGKA